MLISRHIALLLLFMLLIGVSALLNGEHESVFAQQPSTVKWAERERGIRLYEQGDLIGAIKALREAVKQHPDDADAWHYLGLAYSRNIDRQDARKAFEEAIRLRPGFALAHSNLAYTLFDLNKVRNAEREAQNALALDPGNATAHFVLGTIYLREGEATKAIREAEAALKTRDDFSAALLLKTQALLDLYTSEVRRPRTVPPSGEESRAALRSILKQAAESLDKYLKVEPNPADAQFWREQLEAMRFYASFKDKPSAEGGLFSSKEVTTKVHIKSKPAPDYPAAARYAGLEGTVVLSAVFASDGKVKHILVLRALPLGMTQRAVDAARKIRFEPAMKDGRPVSMFYRIEYNFKL